MKALRSTLLTDGSSDRALGYPIRWILRQYEVPFEFPNWADLRGLVYGEQPKDLGERVGESLRRYPCDILFVHRDAESQSYERRQEEILRAVESAEVPMALPVVCVIPVRMQEAWFLISPDSVRAAAGNPNGRMPLDLPPLNKLESIADPKQVLKEALRRASGLSGRRLKRFRPSSAVHRTAELINDFSPLRALSAFRRLEESIAGAFSKLG